MDLLPPPSECYSRIVCADIPDDLVTIILTMLPVKSLTRFRCVSKSWLSIISSIKFHLQFPPRPVFALVKHKQLVCRIPLINDNSSEILQLYFDSGHEFGHEHDVQIIGSCNGLVCVFVSGTPNVFIIWNPATKKFHQLPSSGIPRNYGRGVMQFSCGFGYDASTGDYKLVVSGFHIQSRNIDFLQRIYSLRSNSWKVLTSNVSDIGFGICNRIGVFVNGALHWSLNRNNDGNFRILAVSLRTEAATVIQPPPGNSADDWVILGASQDCLCLISCRNGYKEYWMMQKYGIKESWTKIMHHSFTTTNIPRQYYPSPDIPEYDEDSGMSHNEWIVEKLCRFDEIPSNREYIKFETVTYSETLVSPTPLLG